MKMALGFVWGTLPVVDFGVPNAKGQNNPCPFKQPEDKHYTLQPEARASKWNRHCDLNNCPLAS